MSVKRINIKDLLQYEGREGLILQGCGGDPQEWIDGINEHLTKQEILLDGTKFEAENCAVFDNDGITCILYEFNDKVNLNIGKLAMWRVGTHDEFGGTWLTDFVDHKFGGFRFKEQSEQTKPDCPLIGQDGNIFNLMGIASRTLHEHGMTEQSKEMTKRITDSAQSYYDALNIIGEYVNITSVDDMNEDMDEDEGMDFKYD